MVSEPPTPISFPCSKAPPPESTAPPTPESPTDSPVKPLPVPAPSEFSGDLSSRSPLCSHSMLQQRKEEGGKTEDGANPRYIYAKTCSDAHPVLPDYTCQGRGLIKRNSTSSSDILSVDNAGSTHRAVTHQDIPGELSKLSTSVYQLAASMGMQISEALATESSPAATVSVSPFSFTSLPGSTKTVVSALSTPPSTAAAASVTPELLDEMPTPKSCPRTYGTSLDDSFEHQTSIQSSGLQGGRTNLDYPLELASPPVSFSAVEKVCATASLAPGLYSNDNDPAGSDLMLVHNLLLPLTAQDTPSVCKVLETEHTSACLNITLDVCDFTLELQQDDEKPRHQTPIQSSCVQVDSTKLSEQTLAGMPQAYGLHNLICRTVVRADGTEHSYYALPGNYPIEQDTPEPLFSNESVDVFASKLGQQPYKEEHQEDVQDFSLELQQQDNEKAYICPVLKASISVVTNSSQLSSEHSMRELRLLWDPGASAVIVIPLKNGSSNYFFSHDKADLWSQSEHQSIVLRVVFEEVMLDKPPAKPPDRFRIADSSLQDICVLLEAIPSCKRIVFSLGNFSVSALWRNTTQTEDKIIGRLYMAANLQNLFPDISRGDTENIGIFLKLLPWSIRSAQHFQDFSMQMCSTFSTGCILLWNPWYAILILQQFLWEFSVKQGTLMPWAPGYATVAMTCEHATTGKTMVCMEMHCGSTTVQVREQRFVLEFSLMAAMLPNGSEFRDGQLLYMSQGTSDTSPGCITKRTSTTSSAITACPISFIIDQWEFLHQQGVKKYCYEKNLLPSSNYLKILEMDITFITFLPP